MIQIIVFVYIFMKLYYLHKPYTGVASKDNDIRRFAEKRANRSNGSKVVSLILICLLTFGTFFCGIIFLKYCKDDGAYAFTGKSVDLNECIAEGTLPEEHSYVTLDFNKVGQQFEPIYEGYNRVYYPVVIDESSVTDNRPSVFAIFVNKSEIELLDEYAKDTKKDIKNVKKDSSKESLKYTGRIVYFLPEMEEVYRNAVSESGIKGEDYIIRPMVINTDIDQEEERHKLTRLFTALHTFYSFALMLCINELINSGKFD